MHGDVDALDRKLIKAANTMMRMMMMMVIKADDGDEGSSGVVESYTVVAFS